VRDLTGDAATLLPGTAGAYLPAFSPDGRWIAYFADRALWKIAASGGSPQRLTDVEPSSRGLTWLGMDQIVFAPTSTSPLHVVSAAGGSSRAITSLDPGDGSRAYRSHRWPAAGPDGRSVVFTAQYPGETFGESSLAVVDVASGRTTTLLDDAGTYPIVLPGDRLLYTSGATVYAGRMDWSAPASSARRVPSWMTSRISRSSG